MKKNIIIISIICLMIMPTIVFAGDINGNEASIISAASGTFNYNGRQYVATQGSIGTLSSYLSKDNIDLNAAQASRAINLMNSNVRAGIENGSIVLLGGDSADGSDTNQNSDNKTTNNTKNTTSSKGPATVKVIASKALVSVTNASGKSVFTASFPVKNTGYSLNGILMIGIIFSVLLITCIVFICKFKLFGRVNEA